ncbi:hypothetical protein EHW97_06510 [Aeromicrobium camelliae]|uniref:Uncharacterized protein n=1 Tax=Aeromicrobium camelliae TaxID=1538144 RepID=A0A3N6WU85_9ACTN|nr:hypothetical protein [Aeromicrobium camelliae]RQN08532.1 hypothetical protein EHW97_06510 [Aeromicrobium camelliae]
MFSTAKGLVASGVLVLAVTAIGRASYSAVLSWLTQLLAAGEQRVTDTAIVLPDVLLSFGAPFGAALVAAGLVVRALSPASGADVHSRPAGN